MGKKKLSKSSEEENFKEDFNIFFKKRKNASEKNKETNCPPTTVATTVGEAKKLEKRNWYFV